jgi:hypothetical protein
VNTQMRITQKRKTPRLVLLCLATAMLAACGESPQVVRYHAGKYQGKADARPWESATYNGDKARWESDIRARSDGQTELKRIPE